MCCMRPRAKPTERVPRRMLRRFCPTVRYGLRFRPCYRDMLGRSAKHARIICPNRGKSAMRRSGLASIASGEERGSVYQGAFDFYQPSSWSTTDEKKPARRRVVNRGGGSFSPPFGQCVGRVNRGDEHQIIPFPDRESPIALAALFFMLP